MSLSLPLKGRDPVVHLVDINEELTEYLLNIAHYFTKMTGEGYDEYYMEFGTPLDIIIEAMAGAFKADLPIKTHRRRSGVTNIVTPRTVFYEAMVEKINEIVEQDPDLASMYPSRVDLYNSMLILGFNREGIGDNGQE